VIVPIGPMEASKQPQSGQHSLWAGGSSLELLLLELDEEGGSGGSSLLEELLEELDAGGAAEDEDEDEEPEEPEDEDEDEDPLPSLLSPSSPSSPPDAEDPADELLELASDPGQVCCPQVCSSHTVALSHWPKSSYSPFPSNPNSAGVAPQSVC